MKLYAYRRIGKIEFETCELPPEAHVQQIGTVELTEPKKTVTKEAEVSAIKGESREIDNKGTFEFLGHHATFWIPGGAKNIRCTYEVEE